jgi:hypothetical protein
MLLYLRAQKLNKTYELYVTHQCLQKWQGRYLALKKVPRLCTGLSWLEYSPAYKQKKLTR